MFETEVGGANESLSQRQVRRPTKDILSIFFNMNVRCLFSLESPHRGDSNVYIQPTIINIKEIHPKISQIQ